MESTVRSEVNRAKSRLKDGNQEYGAGNFRPAIVAYAQAVRIGKLCDSPEALAAAARASCNIAYCWENLNDLVQAESAYDDALRLGGASELANGLQTASKAAYYLGRSREDRLDIGPANHAYSQSVNLGRRSNRKEGRKFAALSALQAAELLLITTRGNDGIAHVDDLYEFHRMPIPESRAWLAKHVAEIGVKCPLNAPRNFLAVAADLGKTAKTDQGQGVAALAKQHLALLPRARKKTRAPAPKKDPKPLTVASNAAQTGQIDLDSIRPSTLDLAESTDQETVRKGGAASSWRHRAAITAIEQAKLASRRERQQTPATRHRAIDSAEWLLEATLISDEADEEISTTARVLPAPGLSATSSVLCSDCQQVLDADWHAGENNPLCQSCAAWQDFQREMEVGPESIADDSCKACGGYTTAEERILSEGEVVCRSCAAYYEGDRRPNEEGPVDGACLACGRHSTTEDWRINEIEVLCPPCAAWYDSAPSDKISAPGVRTPTQTRSPRIAMACSRSRATST